MGCAVSVMQTPAQRDVAEMENAAEKLLKQSMEDERYRFKVLLLGAGESGKSTVVKQIKVIWNVQEASDENKKYVQPLQRNVIEAIHTLLQAAKTLNIPLEDASLRADADKIMHLDNNARVTPQLAPIVQRLWKDAGVQRVYERRSEYWLMDATPYYLDEVMRIADPNFSPNEDDMIMARVRTTGIVVSEVQERPFRFEIVDVGGQRSERRKWIHCFDDVKAIIYLASLSGYNQVLFEDSSENIMNESLKLFDEVVKNPIFKNTPIFVFLNKKDLFEDMIKKVSIRKCFPDYTGPDQNMNAALDFIQQKFRDTLHQHVPGKALPIHIIAARVRRDMKMAFGEVKDNLKKSAQQPQRNNGFTMLKTNAVSPATAAR